MDASDEDVLDIDEMQMDGAEEVLLAEQMLHAEQMIEQGEQMSESESESGEAESVRHMVRRELRQTLLGGFNALCLRRKEASEARALCLPACYSCRPPAR